MELAFGYMPRNPNCEPCWERQREQPNIMGNKEHCIIIYSFLKVFISASFSFLTKSSVIVRTFHKYDTTSDIIDYQSHIEKNSMCNNIIYYLFHLLQSLSLFIGPFTLEVGIHCDFIVILRKIVCVIILK